MAVLDSHSEIYKNYGKIEHEIVLKMWPSFKWNIWMKDIRESYHKLIEVSLIEIGVQLLKLWN